MQIVGDGDKFRPGKRLWQAKNKFAALTCMAAYSIGFMVAGAIVYRAGLHWQIYQELQQTAIPYVQAGWKAPKNTLASLTANPISLKIDMKWEAKQQLAYQRQQALDVGVILSENKQMVSATISDGLAKTKVKMRLKGDWVDHLRNRDKWSFRVKVASSDTFMGMKQFSLHHPKTRNWAGEWLFHKALKREGLIGLRYEFVNVSLNGKSLGIYALEEHFEKRLIENNQRREGPIVRFSEDVLWPERVQQEHLFPGTAGSGGGEYLASEVNSYQLTKALEDEDAKIQHLQAIQLLDLFRRNELLASEVFDVKKMAKYMALVELFGAPHALIWHNMRFYYNPITSRLEPIGFDGNAGEQIEILLSQLWTRNIGSTLQNHQYAFFQSIFEDQTLHEEYVAQLKLYSNKSYLDTLLKEESKNLNQAIRTLHTEFAYYEFDPQVLYNNQGYIRSVLNPVNGVLAYHKETANGKITLQVGNIQCMPIRIKGLQITGQTPITAQPTTPTILASRRADRAVDYNNVYFDLPQPPANDPNTEQTLTLLYEVPGTNQLRRTTVANYAFDHQAFSAGDFIRQPSTAANFQWITIDEPTKSIYIKQGRWTIDKDLIIPAGYHLYVKAGTHLDLVNNAVIISFSPISMFGNEDSPITINSSDKTGQGIAVLQAQSESELHYVHFTNLTYPNKGQWSLTGAVTFYESPVLLSNCRITNNQSEDGLNIVRSDFEISNCAFTNSMSDSFDADFSKGSISNTNFTQCGNDGIDVSGSVVKLVNVTINVANDKALSAGEASHVKATNLQINNAKIALASKDRSILEVDNVTMDDCYYPLAVFKKKTEFGPAVLAVNNMTANNITMKPLIETGSTAIIDGNHIPPNNQDIRNILYATQASTAQVKQ